MPPVSVSVHTQHLRRTRAKHRERIGASFPDPQHRGPEEDPARASVVPPVPETLEDTGLAATLVQQLILKMLYSRGDMLGRELSEALGLKFSLIEETIEFLKRQHFIEAKKSLGMGNSTVLFALTDTGKNAARECMESNQYAGPAPFRWLNTPRWCGDSGARTGGSRLKLCSKLTAGWW